MNENGNGGWSEKIALWGIVIVLIVLALMWYVNKQGGDKADLAAAVQSANSRLNAIEVATTAQGNEIKTLNGVLSATTQAVGDFKGTASEMLANLNGAVFAPRFGNGGGNGCGCSSGPRFVKRANYSLDESSLQEIDTCG